MTAAYPRLEEEPAVRPHLVAYDPVSFVRPVTRLAGYLMPAPNLPVGERHPLSGRRVVVLGHSEPLVTGLAEALGSRGVTATPAIPGQELPDSVLWDGIIDLNLTGWTYQLGDESWRPCLTRTVDVLRRVYRHWVREPRYHHHFYLAMTNLGGGMGYHTGPIPQPLGGLWSGLAKSLPYEMPTVAVKIIDLDRPCIERLAEVVEQECTQWDHLEVAYPRGVRHTVGLRQTAAPPPTISIGAGDTVLVSGGARGIGFVVAQALAAQGASVLVTGRRALPNGNTPWLLLDEEAFRSWRKDQLATATDPRGLARLRHTVREAEESRDAWQNLARARDAGLEINYVRCDVTVRDQVRELLAGLPSPPTVLIHNAGTYHALRLDKAPLDQTIQTIAVKVTGFANLLGEINASDERRQALRLLCNVGSVGGRFGGLVGQIAYAAANDALTRLGFWARDNLGLPTQTLCWPTWDHVGNIANHAAVLRYGSTINQADGATHWLAELSAAHHEEIIFLGRVGSAITPSHAQWTPLPPEHPDRARLASLRHYLGKIDSYQPSGHLCSRHRLRVTDHPCLQEFTIDDDHALPLSILLEYATAAGDWIMPDGWPRLHLREVRAIEVRLRSLLFQRGQLMLTRRATGGMRDGLWNVDVEMNSANDTRLATMTLIYGDRPGSLDMRPAPTAFDTPAELAPSRQYQWRKLIFGRPCWYRADSGWYRGTLRPLYDADLWATPTPPVTSLPLQAIEALMEAFVAQRSGSEATLHVRRLQLTPQARQTQEIIGAPDCTKWSGLVDGRPAFHVEIGTLAWSFHDLGLVALRCGWPRFSACGRAWRPGCRAGWAGFHGPWRFPFLPEGRVAAGQPVLLQNFPLVL
jgi:NAD(P)-dependent dehydrogenase (short-subunit alcohol dehydrogenase family)